MSDIVIVLADLQGPITFNLTGAVQSWTWDLVGTCQADTLPLRAVALSARKAFLVVPTLREAWLMDTRRRAFSVVAPLLWNYLPLQIYQAPSLATFRSPGKDGLLNFYCSFFIWAKLYVVGYFIIYLFRFRPCPSKATSPVQGILQHVKNIQANKPLQTKHKTMKT